MPREANRDIQVVSCFMLRGTPSTGENFELLPARMLNEFVYCPRLFFYEHVEGVFVHNADTLRGAAQHTRVDAGSGALPAASQKGEDAKADGRNRIESPAGESPMAQSDRPNESAPSEATGPSNRESEIKNEVIHTRSVMLGSEKLGVVAKLDLVEVTLDATDVSAGDDSAPRARVVRPVEYKAGAPRDDVSTGALGLWDTDRMQLGLQILLLRENGYTCDEGVVFYRQTRQRVRFALDGETESWIFANIDAARSCLTGPIPPPLEHSPKCPRCSLVSVCLPDETQLLRQSPDGELPDRIAQLSLPGLGLDAAAVADQSDVAVALDDDDPIWDALPEPRFPRAEGEGTVRRLIAPDIDTKALYVNTAGVSIAKKGDAVVVKDKGEVTAEVLIKDLHHVAIFGAAQLSTSLVQTLCEREIPVSYFSMGGWFYGLTRGHGLSNVFTRVRQFAQAGSPEQALPLARLFVHGKIRNQRTLLMRNHVEPPPLVLRALKHAAAAALAANSHAMLLGIEGAAALYYFRHFGGMIKGAEERDDAAPTIVGGNGGNGAPRDQVRNPGTGMPTPSAAMVAAPAQTMSEQTMFTFDFRARNRRPPRDAVNALLSFAYSLLARDCTIAAYAVGFDPYIGFYHQPRFGRPALALDVMEEFRPLVADSVVLTVINNRMVTPQDFVKAGEAVNLSAAGRKTFLFAYEKRMGDIVTHPVFDYKVSYRRAIELQCRLLARALTGEIERYVPFMTR